MRPPSSIPYGTLDAAGNPLVAEIWPRRPRWAAASISEFDAAFFAGLVMHARPAKLLEVGAASGWGSCVLLKATERAGLPDSVLFSVDIAERFFYNPEYRTGQCVGEVYSALLPRYRLLTGKVIADCVSEVGGGIDFAFIDAHHMHPWATLDLLAVLPYMKPSAWVALHDITLSRKEDQGHQNRGPKYLFEGWDGEKLHSVQEPPMAGAIRLGADPAAHLPLLLDILHTPWELPLDPRVAGHVCRILREHYGEEWAARFRRAAEICNYHVNKVHSPDIDRLHAELAAERAKKPLLKRLFGAGR